MIHFDEFLNRAKFIYASCDSGGSGACCLEMDFRDCARSAYYYIYHVGLIRAEEIKGEFDERVGNHQRVIKKLMSSDKENDQALADVLLRAKPSRVKADYHLRAGFSKTEAYKILRLAEKLMVKHPDK